ncbi:MAG TPA: 3-isopropylmalate dehydratase small subunit, partial [Xanthomonadales bacterium]|nr:3-isopropylmalate dehydratase small subunit [Xanthomonadales bacterium]
NGLLPIVVSEADWQRLAACDGEPVEIDLASETIRFGADESIGFAIEAFARRCLLDGVDELGWLLARTAEISAFEQGRPT